MQPRSEDRYLFHLAAWLEAMDEDELSDEAGTGDQAAATHEAGFREFRPLNFNGRNSAIFEGESARSHPHANLTTAPQSAGGAHQSQLLHIERITRKSLLEHPLLAPRLDEIYDKARMQNPALPATLEKFVNETIDEERGTKVVVNGHVN